MYILSQQGETGGPGQKGSKGDKGEAVSPNITSPSPGQSALIGGMSRWFQPSVFLGTPRTCRNSRTCGPARSSSMLQKLRMHHMESYLRWFRLCSVLLCISGCRW